jgi:hypothetical protein
VTAAAAASDTKRRPLKVFVQQPYFLPWVGFWNKYVVSDVYVAFAGVQYSTRQFTKRVQLAGAWFGLPILDFHRGQLLNQARFDLGELPNAARRLRMTIAGKRYPHAARIGPVIQALESYSGSPRLIDVNLHLIEIIRELLGIARRPTIVDEDPRPNRSGTQRVCAAALLGSGGASAQYLSGALGVDYLTRDEIPDNVEVLVQQVSIDAPRGTVLEVMAQEDDPLPIIENCAMWLPLDAAQAVWKANKKAPADENA